MSIFEAAQAQLETEAEQTHAQWNDGWDGDVELHVSEGEAEDAASDGDFLPESGRVSRQQDVDMRCALVEAVTRRRCRRWRIKKTGQQMQRRQKWRESLRS